MWKTEGLKQALDNYGFDAAFGGARRDEEKSRAKERIFSFRSAAAPLGPEEAAARSCGGSTTPATAPGESIRVFPLSNWTELDVWQYIHLEEIPIVPLYFAAQRPVVERDGTLIMVDDERMPLDPGEVPEMRSVRFRTLGCYPLTGAIESDAGHAPRDHPGDAARHHLRAPGPGDRPRLVGLDGEEEAGGLLLMAHAANDLLATDIDAYLAHHEHKSLLRFITCGSVDDGKSHAHRPPALRLQAGLRGPARRARGPTPRRSAPRAATSTSPSWSTASPPSASRASPSTSPTGSSPPRSASSSSPTPPATSSTPATWSPARRPPTWPSILIDARKGVLTQTRRHSYLVSLLGIRHVVLAINKIDLVDYSQDVFDQIVADYRDFAAEIGIDDFAAIPMSALRGDNITEPQPEHALVRRARR